MMMMAIHQAPLAKYSSRCFLKMMRCITKHSTIWTEMLHVNVVLHREPVYLHRRFFPPRDDVNAHPTVLQLASGSVEDLRKAFSCLENMGALDRFSEVNLNCGCPADSASSGSHGASLLLRSERARFFSLLEVLQEECKKRGLRSSAKVRVGIVGDHDVDSIDHHDDDDGEKNFVSLSQQICSRVDHIIIHARKAVIGGTSSPRDNLRVPPLLPHVARAALTHLREEEREEKKKKKNPTLLTFNGELKGPRDAEKVLREWGFNGAMIGRMCISDPYGAFAGADDLLNVGGKKRSSREEVVETYAKWLREEMEIRGFQHGDSCSMQPMLNLWHGTPASGAWKRFLVERTDLDMPDRLLRALDFVVPKARD